MPKVGAKVDDLVVFLEEMLSQEPCEAGMCLIPERHLADILGTHRMKIQRAFDALVERGVLFRQRGSGTFIRKVPPRKESYSVRQFHEHSVRVTQLLAPPAKAPVRRQAKCEHRKLELLLVANDRCESLANQSKFQGISDRIKQEGHALKIFNPEGMNPRDMAYLAQNLKQYKFDGCIIWNSYSEILKKAYGDKIPPVVYIGVSSREGDLECAPLVRVNLEDAIVRAFKQFVKEGCKKIAFISYASPVRSLQEVLLYEKLIAENGLSFRASALCDLTAESATQAVSRIFKGKLRPEAVYVADDIVLQHLVPAWQAAGIQPGENLRVITLSNFGHSLPSGYKWSCMEVQPFQVGRMAVDSLLLEIQTAGETICSFEHLANWKPGETHRLRQA